jgi:hypothetical protein
VVLRAAQTRIAPLKAHVTYPEKRPYAGLFFACHSSFFWHQAKKNRALRPVCYVIRG